MLDEVDKRIDSALNLKSGKSVSLEAELEALTENWKKQRESLLFLAFLSLCQKYRCT